MEIGDLPRQRKPQTSAAAWEAISQVVEARDPLCRGVVLLGLDMPEERLAASFAAAAGARAVKGFAVGRSIFAQAAEGWLSGALDDAAAVDDMAARYARLCDLWAQAARGA